MKTATPFETQLETHSDYVACRKCKHHSNVKIHPDQRQPKWQCRHCNIVQVWVPSNEYSKRAFNN